MKKRLSCYAIGRAGVMRRHCPISVAFDGSFPSIRRMHAASIQVRDHMTLRAIPCGGGMVVACARHGVVFGERPVAVAAVAAVAAVVADRLVPCPLCVADAFGCD